jgi:hypothetical protein
MPAGLLHKIADLLRQLLPCWVCVSCESVMTAPGSPAGAAGVQSATATSPARHSGWTLVAGGGTM